MPHAVEGGGPVHANRRKAQGGGLGRTTLPKAEEAAPPGVVPHTGRPRETGALHQAMEASPAAVALTWERRDERRTGEGSGRSKEAAAAVSGVKGFDGRRWELGLRGRPRLFMHVEVNLVR